MENHPEIAEIDPVYGCLATQHGIGGVGIERLLGRFGDAAAVYGAGPEAWRQALPRIPGKTIESLRRGPDPKAWEALMAQCRDLGIAITAPGRAGYPEPLAALPAPPPILYLRGRWTPEDARSVAIVGTREPTDYGRRAAYALARDFSAAGYAVVSGLAAGIDGAAHAGAIEGGGRTIAVIGCGLDIPYPLENLSVRARMEADEGARGLVVSEFPPGVEPRAGHFPRRNRIISALARAVVVVEAGGKSGALLTAANAREQGRPLFAVPGPIFSAMSAGTTTLLRRGALPVASIDDVIRVLEGNAPRRMIHPSTVASYAEEDEASRPPPRARAVRTVSSAPAATGSKSPRKGVALEPPRPPDPLLELWEDEESCGLDALAARAAAQGLWPAEKAATELLERLLLLELQGRVRRLPGAVYRRAG